eukprot:gene9901-biopygen2900
MGLRTRASGRVRMIASYALHLLGYSLWGRSAGSGRRGISSYALHPLWMAASSSGPSNSAVGHSMVFCHAAEA